MEITSKEFEYLAKIGLLREQHGFTQQQLADFADIDIATLIQIENGIIDVPLGYMYRIQKSLEISPGEFYTDIN